MNSQYRLKPGGREVKCPQLHKEYVLYSSKRQWKLNEPIEIHAHTYIMQNNKSYSIFNFGILESSGGRDPDNLLLSRRLQVQRYILSTTYRHDNEGSNKTQKDVLISSIMSLTSNHQLTGEEGLAIGKALMGFALLVNCCSCDCSIRGKGKALFSFIFFLIKITKMEK